MRKALYLTLAVLCFIQTTLAVGPCRLLAASNTERVIRITRDDQATENYPQLPLSECGSVFDRYFDVGYFEERIGMEDCWFYLHGSIRTACVETLTLVNSDTCSGPDLGSSTGGVSFTSDMCRRPQCPEEGAVDCEEIAPAVSNATTGWGQWQVISLVLGGLLILTVGGVIGLLASQSKIEQPQRYPQFSVAHRDKVAASMKPQSVASPTTTTSTNNETSGNVGKPDNTTLLSSATEIGPVLSRTRVAIISVLCLLLAFGHIPLALAFGASGLFLPFIAALAWIAATYFGVRAFLGYNTFEAWHKATTIGLAATVLGNLIGFMIWVFALSKAGDVCRSACSSDPLYGDPCRLACGSLGVALVGPIINLVLLFAFMGFVFSQTKRGVNGNGKVMSFGLTFPTETGFKNVARPPPGGSHGSRRSQRSQRGSKGSRRGSRGSKRGSGRQAP